MFTCWFISISSYVDVKVISGDNPLTVSVIASKVGIENAENYISLDGMSDEEVLAVAEKYTVFGRVKPHQKQLLVKALKEAKQYVKEMKDAFDDSINVKTKVVTGLPSESIINVAEEENVDLIIIASSGKSGLHRFVIGSVAEEVLKNADMDVLLVHD